MVIHTYSLSSWEAEAEEALKPRTCGLFGQHSKPQLIKVKKAKRDGSVVKSVRCSSRRSRFDSQCPRWAAHNCNLQLQEFWHHLLDFSSTYTYAHTQFKFKIFLKPGLMTQACNYSHYGGWNRRITCSFRPSSHKVNKKRTGDVAQWQRACLQAQGPRFNFQYWGEEAEILTRHINKPGSSSFLSSSM